MSRDTKVQVRTAPENLARARNGFLNRESEVRFLPGALDLPAGMGQAGTARNPPGRSPDARAASSSSPATFHRSFGNRSA